MGSKSRSAPITALATASKLAPSLRHASEVAIGRVGQAFLLSHPRSHSHSINRTLSTYTAMGIRTTSQRDERMDKPTNIEIETPGSGAFSALEVKTCCAAIYQSDWARLLLGDSFHPGGMALTEHLGMLLDLAPGKQVLDVAAGQGTSAIFLAQRFGCQVVGLDYGEEAVRQATQAAEETGIAHLVRFEQGDAECLSAADGAFDAVICECAFCTFPDKRAAADEFARVLRPGGRVGLSDLTRAGAVPSELQGLLAWAACIADAQPLE